MTATPTPTPLPALRNRSVLIWMIASQLLGALSLLPWLIMAGLAVMAFDSGFSPQAAAFVGAIWSYPLLPIGAAIVSWFFYAKRRMRAAAIATSIPMVLVLPLILYMGYAMF